MNTYERTKWLTTKQAADFLGVSPKAILNKVHIRLLRVHKLGRHNRYTIPDLEALIFEPSDRISLEKKSVSKPFFDNHDWVNDLMFSEQLQKQVLKIYDSSPSLEQLAGHELQLTRNTKFRFPDANNLKEQSGSSNKRRA
jgi:excisionase family DNA binding protein